MAKYEIIRLKNGTYSVYSVAHGETFHPVVGPVAEAEALYVRQLRIPERIAAADGEFVIWDVGLGAAANVLAAIRAAREIRRTVRIVSFDCTMEPLRFALKHSRCLGYLDGYERHLSGLVSKGRTRFDDARLSVDWRVRVSDFPSLMECAGREALPAPDAILFDAYSPATNPAMWTQAVFHHLYRALDPARPCALATYSRSTMLRVSLLLAGFLVGAGSATGEKEETTIAANTLDLIDAPLDTRWLKRTRNSTSAEPLQSATYRQERLSEASWRRLLHHPQFR